MRLQKVIMVACVVTIGPTIARAQSTPKPTDPPKNPCGGPAGPGNPTANLPKVATRLLDTVSLKKSADKQVASTVTIGDEAITLGSLATRASAEGPGDGTCPKEPGQPKPKTPSPKSTTVDPLVIAPALKNIKIKPDGPRP